MKIAFFDTHKFEKPYFIKANAENKHEIVFFETRLTSDTAYLAKNADAVCVFVSDVVNQAVIQILAAGGVRLIALRCAGFNNVDLEAAHAAGIEVVRVPEYSPHAVAEHAVALLLTLNRKTHRAYNRVRESNFSLDGLVGFDLFGKTVGVVGTGRIGTVFAKIMVGFGCHVLAYDRLPNSELQKIGVKYVSLDDLVPQSDVISLHIPLTPESRHLINAKRLAQAKRGAILINTGRGALIDSAALVQELKSGGIGGAGLDVYEEEEGIFFKDLSGHVLQDDILARLMTFPNVLLTSHQAFLTAEALREIAQTTLNNISEFARSPSSTPNTVHASTHIGKS